MSLGTIAGCLLAQAQGSQPVVKKSSLLGGQSLEVLTQDWEDHCFVASDGGGG